jgi:hypothetical protein
VEDKMPTGKWIITGALLVALLAGCEAPNRVMANGNGDVLMDEVADAAAEDDNQDRDREQSRGQSHGG